MRKFDIFTEICLGFSHCGGVYEDSSAEIDLTDDEIKTLYEVMEKALAEDEDEDLEDLDLAYMDLDETHPELYEKLYDAYYECAREAEFAHWVEHGYWDHDILENANWDRAYEVCRERYGYIPETEMQYEDDDYHNARLDSHFRQWFKDNIICDSKRRLDFERKVYFLGVEVDEVHFDGRVLPPPALVKEFLESR